jgi:hypothetical protein
MSDEEDSKQRTETCRVCDVSSNVYYYKAVLKLFGDYVIGRTNRASELAEALNQKG